MTKRILEAIQEEENKQEIKRLRIEE